MKNLFLITAIAFSTLCACATPKTATQTKAPAAWVVSDADSEMILFPTVHVLPEGLDWQTDRLNGLMASADEVWFELGRADDPAVVAEVQQLMAEHGLSPDRPLSSRLTAEQYAKLEAATAKLGMPAAQLDAVQPWLAALTLMQADLARSGITSERGVETVLTAELSDRSARSLETPADQIRIFAELDEPLQIEFLMQSIDGVGEAAERLDRIARGWAVSDLDLMETELLAEMQTDYPEVYKAVFTARNENWAEQLSDELEGSGSDFIAVGAGHLIGDDSVQEMLRSKGYQVSRVDLSE